VNKESTTPTIITTDDYELVFAGNSQSLLVLFPCFPCDALNTKQELPIVDAALSSGIAIMLMNFNQRLWLSQEEKDSLHSIITEAAKAHSLPTEDIYIGGFSSGGNVSLLLADYIGSSKSDLSVSGVFIVDSPVDLLALYQGAHKIVERDFSQPAIMEANMIINKFDRQFGQGDSSLQVYQERSPYTAQSHTVNNLSHLQDVEIRLYSEPDTAWWRENRQTPYEDMNAHHIERMEEDLRKLYGDAAVHYIKTNDRGYRANGVRHPHSWAIVDAEELIQWINK